MNKFQIEDCQIRGVWVIVEQDGNFVVCQEENCSNGNKPQFGKKPEDYLVGAAETREGEESIFGNAQRAMLEEIGMEKGYELAGPLGYINVNVQGGEFIVGVMHAKVDKGISIAALRSVDPDSKIVSLMNAGQILSEVKPQRAGSLQALQFMRGLMEDGKIIQAKRYDPT